MRGIVRIPVAVVAAIMLIATLAACGSGNDEEFSGRQLENPWQVESVPLTATDGTSYDLAKDAEDPLTLVFFGYTHCPDICPAVMNNIGAAMNRLDDADRERVGVVFVTTDPTRDDEKTLRRYLDGYGEGFTGLTGPIDDVIALGEPLNVYVNNGEKLPTGGYDLGGHSTFVLGIEDSEAVAIWTEQASAVELATDIHILLED